MNPKDQIKENLSITDVVATYVRLEKSGSQFRARCPFHNERTPSFYVSPERKSFHCFGCQVHGDIFTFVEKIENIPFIEALKILADRAGVSLKDSQKNKEDTKLIALLKDATEHFEKNLTQSPEARAYLIERGLLDETIKTFHIGYAKNEWRDLFVYLSSRGYSPEEMVQAGVVIEVDRAKTAEGTNGSSPDTRSVSKGWYDRFRGRIMFPIRNVSGATVGYSGRIMPSLVDPTVAQGKYVNTPETALYHKSKILFGYDTAKKSMSESKSVVVVEGQMDLCMSYQAGVHNTVAVSGTAFTDEHIHIIKRFCDTVILSFDADTAGQNALKKTALLCLLGGLDVYVVGDFSNTAYALGTKDPADLIKEDKEAWVDAVKNKRHVVETMLSLLFGKEPDIRIRGQKIVTDVLPFVRAIQSPIDRAHFIKLISQKSGIGEQVLTEELSRGITVEQVTEKESIATIPSKERLTRELIAFVKLLDKENDERVVALLVDMEQFPEAIIQEHMFTLEEKVIGNKDKYLDDLIVSYKKELHKEHLQLLQQKLQVEGVNSEEILKEIETHMRKGLLI